MVKLSKLFIILVFPLVFTQCGKKDFRKDTFVVNKIVSGNQIGLINGYSVNLIGIDNTKQAEDFLYQNVINKKVKFVFDSRSPFKKIHPKTRDKSFYAYAVLENGECINSKMLRDNHSKLFLQPNLNDSLQKYMTYANVVQEEIKKKEEEMFATGCRKELIKLKDACDYMNPTTRDFAVKNAGKSAGVYNIGQVCNIFAAIRPPNWHYVNDPLGNEFYSKASLTISQTNLSGDCDDYAVLMFSLITSIGGEARLNFVWGLQGGHAFTEVNISKFNFLEVERTIKSNFPDYDINRINYRTDNSGTWLNLDWWASYPGGPYMDFAHSMTFNILQDNCDEN